MKNTISELILKDGCRVTNFENFLLEAKLFYEKLYTHSSEVSSELFFDDIEHVKLDGNQQYLCEGLFTLNECKDALLSMPNNKTPGSDGLSIEFYKTFWDEIGPLLVRSLNYAFHNGHLSESCYISAT